jgi:hypothetical protein
MADNKQLMYAREAYNTLCRSLDNIGWTYKRMDDELKLMFSVGGDDIPMNFLIIIDADRQLVRLLSLLPFQMNSDKRVEGAIATCIINYVLADGSFDFDLDEGHIMFRLTASFRESLLGEELFKYMVSIACHTIDKYNDQLCDLNDGKISLEDFMKNNA